MKMNDVFPSKYLKADDLEDGDWTLTIRNEDPVTHEEFTQKGKPTPDNKPVLHFKERDAKPLVLNKTNWKTIGQALGSDDSDDWCGRQITLFATEVESFGEMTMAIRIRLKAPKSAKAVTNSRNTVATATAIEVGEPITANSATIHEADGATQFWTTTNGLGIDKAKAQPIAMQAVTKKITWDEAIEQLKSAEDVPF